MNISIKYKDWTIATHENFKSNVVESLVALEVVRNMQEAIRRMKKDSQKIVNLD